MDNLSSEPLLKEAIDVHGYLKERVQDQIDWYDRKSTFNKRWFIWLRAVESASTATVPFLSGFAANL